MSGCCSQEPIPARKERVCGILFWSAVVVFVLIYAVLIDQAIKANKTYQKPANFGMMLSR